MTLVFAGNIDEAKPLLVDAQAHYRKQLLAQTDSFRLLKPLCWADGALGDSEAAADSCIRALQNLPDDFFDRNYHRADIAGGLAMAGLKDEALNLIESVLADRVRPTRTELQLYAVLRNLHEEPRWRAYSTSNAATSPSL